MLIHIMLSLSIIHNIEQLVSVSHTIQELSVAGKNIPINKLQRKYPLSNKFKDNMKFNILLFKYLLVMASVTWLASLILLSGDVQPNPGPPTSSSTSSSIDSSVTSVLSQSHHLSFIHYNVQSILNKLDILTTELSDFDILAFTETWLHPNISDEELQIQSFCKPERKDRMNDPHGGVLIYIKDTIHYKRRLDLEPAGIECIWTEIILRNKHILFGAFYRPPNSSVMYHSTIEDSIHLALDTGIPDVVITGDFNYNLLSDQTNRKISSICQQFSLHQCISEPTHYSENASSLIDIILVSNRNSVIFSGAGDPFLSQNTRYHCPVFGILKFSKPKRRVITRHIWLFEQGNYDLLRRKTLETDWDSLKSEDINKYSETTTKHIIEIAKQCIPNRLIKVNPTEPSWITTNIKRQIRKRKRLYKRAKGANDPDLWRKFKKLRNETIDLIRKAKQLHTKKLTDKLKSEKQCTKNWWSTLKQFINPATPSTVPPLQVTDNVFTNDEDKANLLNDYFQEQTVINDDNVEVPVINDYNLVSRLNSIILTTDEVTTVLKSLPLGKAAGPDGVNNRVLKELADVLSLPLCDLFNQSLSTGEFPEQWKLSHVTPIPKSGDLSLVSNYRPIALLSNIDKVFERAVFKHLYNHLLENSILTPYQSGFTPGDSTINQMTFLYDSFCEALDDGKEIRVVFCDISKAFDRVWHRGLLCKLKAAGVTSTALKWFQSYLSNRKQRVVLPGVLSDWKSIKAGVPQGSILGPLLFLIFINDIVSDINSNIRLFADDTTLYIIVENPQSAAIVLNADMQKIDSWADMWLVKFNPSKSESFIVSRKLNKPYHPPIYMGNTQISEVNTHKHLGIILSHDCSWHAHIEYIKEKAWQRINIMRRLKFVLDRKSLEIIYLSFIRPVLEYGDTIWENCTQYEKKELDKIQNEAARIVTGATVLVSLQSLYQEVGWESLQDRRLKHKLNLFFKMQHDLTPLYLSSLVPPSISETTRYNLRNADDYTTLNCRTQLYYTSFVPSVIREWNALPGAAKQISTLHSFKVFLNQDKTAIPKYFNYGKRKSQVLHTRLRTGCSSLNNDLYLKNISQSPCCACGASVENAYHFFFVCNRFNLQRDEMFQALSDIPHVNTRILLRGDELLSHDTNILIFSSVQKYIETTKRF